MDVWALNLQGGVPLWGSPEKKIERRAAALRLGSCWRIAAGDDGTWGFAGVPEIRIAPGRLPAHYRYAVARAGHRKGDKDDSVTGNNDPSSPKGDNPEIQNPGVDNLKPDGIHMARPLSDWRDFRANLVARGEVKVLDANAPVDELPHHPPRSLGPKWSHPIPLPETGCVLVATEKLDGVPNFERTVVLLLRLGSSDPREGPFGVILNRPQHRKIKHMKLPSSNLASTFADCPLHFGGPLDASMFLLKTGTKPPASRGFDQVVPGICFGARNSLDEAAALVKQGVLEPGDFRFFVGYAGWQFDQLREEIESDYWVVSACSSQLILGTSDSSGLWEEVLQLMGGKYMELSRKPKQDGS